MASDIEWTDDVWNPVVGCARVSPGCENCYAEKIAHRGLSPQHRGLTVLGKAGVRWTGEARFVTEALGRPLRWRKPKRVFVNSMSDLFHESLSMEQGARVRVKLRDRKGGDPSEWPEDLRVRELPTIGGASCG